MFDYIPLPLVGNDVKLLSVVAVIVLCKNWVRVLAGKIFALPVSEIKFRDGTRFMPANSRIGKADLSIIAEIWLAESYNPPFFEIRPGDTVFDIGANQGFFTVYAARKANRGKVYSFEPVPVLAQALKRNVAVNKLTHAYVSQLGIGPGRPKQFLRHQPKQRRQQLVSPKRR